MEELDLFVFDFVLDLDDELLLFFFVVLSFFVVDLVELDFFVVFVVSLSSESEFPESVGLVRGSLRRGDRRAHISNIFDENAFVVGDFDIDLPGSAAE